MTKTYGTSAGALPSSTYYIEGASSVSVSAAFNATVGLVGGYDAADGNAKPGTVYRISDGADAANRFGAGSELAKQYRLAYLNGATEVFAVAVPETQTTESFAASQSLQLANAPIFDPNVNPEHSITVRDTTEGVDLDTKVKYGSLNTPSNANTAYVNPVRGTIETDTSSDYDVTYTYGDYVNTIENSGIIDMDRDIRALGVCTESERVAKAAADEAEARATNFNLFRATAGGHPNGTPVNYDDMIASRRLSIMASARMIDTEGDEVRTAGALAGKIAGAPLGDSITMETFNGLIEPAYNNSVYTPQEAGDLLDKRVIPIIRRDGYAIAKGITTSTTQKFQRIHKCEIVDEVTELSQQITSAYLGEDNTIDNREDMRDDHAAFLADMWEDGLLATGDGSKPYVVTQSQGSTDTGVDLTIGVDVMDVMEDINVNLSVGDVVTLAGQT